MSDLEIAVKDALAMIDVQLRFESTVSDQLIIMTEAMTRQQTALSTMLDLFFVNRNRLMKHGTLPKLLDLIKVAMQAHGHIQDAALEIGNALMKACQEVQSEAPD